MTLVAKPSSPLQGREIAHLLTETLGMDAEPEAWQSWKYWDRHPFAEGTRSYLLLQGDTVVAHGACWPIRLQANFGELNCMHWVDWAANPQIPGAGIQVLRFCQKKFAGVISIGGTAHTKRILPALGFKPYNTFYLLYRPFRPLTATARSAARDWKLPLQAARNLVTSQFPRIRLPAAWSFLQVPPEEIPGTLFPHSVGDEPVSQRRPELLNYLMKYPGFQYAACFLLYRAQSPAAYFCLARRNGQARLIDYGPNAMSEEVGMALALAAQEAARSEYQQVVDILTATTELSVAAGFIRAGFRKGAEDPINVLKVSKALDNTSSFRLTLADSDLVVF